MTSWTAAAGSQMVRVFGRKRATRVTQSEPLNHKSGRRVIALAVLCTLVAIFFSYQRATSTTVMELQAPRQQRRGRPKQRRRVRPPVKTTSSLTVFKHATHREPKTKLICSDCHTIPAREAPDEIAATTKSSIKGYPYHDSCLGCHRRTAPQFFTGATPAICTVCHVSSSPRLTAREIGPFPKHSEEVMELEFPGYFPHAQRDHKREKCETCHMTDERAYVPIPVGGSEAPYKPAERTFRTSPSGHAACFKCHWEDAKPRKDGCAGCHLLNEDVADTGRNLLSANAREWFKSWPRELPKRFSLKFNHDSKEHHNTVCTDCHTNISEMNTLDIFKADVKIAVCATCHFRKDPNIGLEMLDEDTEDTAKGVNDSSSSRQGKNLCTGCHTNAIGSAPPPCSHYLLGDKYLSLEDYSENARRIAEQCKK